jgi:glucose-1-phosphate cytidylyltransferase
MDWNVQLVDTGDDTGTGGRILGCRHLLDRPFFATYADGLSDIPLDRLLAFHEAHDGCATVSSVPLPSQYGTIDADDAGKIRGFHEKPILREHWINAGFFVFDADVFDRWRGDDLEREVLPALADGGQLFAYRHDGFFKSMDSYKDHQEIERMLRDGDTPWKRAP